MRGLNLKHQFENPKNRCEFKSYHKLYLKQCQSSPGFKWYNNFFTKRCPNKLLWNYVPRKHLRVEHYLCIIWARSQKSATETRRFFFVACEKTNWHALPGIGTIRIIKYWLNKDLKNESETVPIQFNVPPPQLIETLELHLVVLVLKLTTVLTNHEIGIKDYGCDYMNDYSNV